MRHVLSFAAAVAVTSPDGTLAPPAIYMIQIPSESEQPLSEEDTNAALAGNRWMVVGDRIVTAQLVQGENGAVDVAKWRPLCDEDYYGAQEAPVLLKTHLFDPHHPDYLEFRKCPSSKHEQAIWMVCNLNCLFERLITKDLCHRDIFSFSPMLARGDQDSCSWLTVAW